MTVDAHTENPPPASAPYDERAAWSEAYVGWFISQVPEDDAPPKDARPTHRWEVEFDSSVDDPEEYWRQTQYELDLVREGDDAERKPETRH